MNITTITRDAYQLFHEGAVALSEIESYGIRIDVDYCTSEQKRLTRRIGRLEEELDGYSEIKLWREQYGLKFNLDSNNQLAWLLFKKLGLESVKLTENENESADQSVLDKINLPFITPLTLYKQLSKVRDTFLAGIMRETVNGYLHPFFNLHVARTYRSSSSHINFQNQPIRINEMKRIIRRAFYARPGYKLGGIDYSGLEVMIATCYHKDPTMLAYIQDPKSDMHKDIAMDLFLLNADQMTKDIRWWGKSGFIFPQFYGDWWKSCAEAMWDAIKPLKTKSGLPLRQHLREQGIRGLGTLDSKKNPSKNSFYAHVKEIENIFWNKRFPVYAQWKKDWVKQYERNGYFDMYTGFRCSGLMDKKMVCNYPVQGAAFHCLLWSLIQLHQWLKDNKMDSRIVGQIHDEIVPDAHPAELTTLLITARRIMCEDLRQHWDWIIVPLEIEAEFAPVDKSWYEVEDVPIPKLTELVPF